MFDPLLTASREPRQRQRQLAVKMFQPFFAKATHFSNAPNISWIAFGDVGQGTFQGSMWIQTYKHTNVSVTYYLSLSYLSRPRDKSIISLSFPNRQTRCCRCCRCLDVAVAVAVAGRRTPYPATVLSPPSQGSVCDLPATSQLLFPDVAFICNNSAKK